ncbi:MAG TPA: tetratricopeptide repeat protein [Luteimonas sp.]|nr:tetratricopeptide repeat protein [Luteimonas sp.]HRO27815.1 tetratricopeptide repeat protein [Luteimonas sp.]HRP73928.1 tetratricopeptide repeat protein [Luteimonas sp.]
MRTVVLLLLLAHASLAWSSTPAIEQAIASSEERIESGDFAGALAVLLPRADSQDGTLAYSLAYAYWLSATVGRAPGDVDSQAATQAIHHAERAIALGDPSGYNLLYLAYANGTGVPEDAARAADYLRRGAEAGDAGSKLNYMQALYQGAEAIERDVAKACPLAFELMDDERTQAIAAHTVGLILIRGECGRTKDAAAGIGLVRLAAEHGVSAAEFDLGHLLEHGVGVEANPSEAMQWYARAAEHGNARAHWRLGMAYVNGEGWARDPAAAVAHFRQAAAAGDPDGMASLATMYASGSGVEQDFARAIALYQEAARAGQPHALRGLAVMHMYGQGVEVDLVRSHLLYLQAVALGNPGEPALDQAIRSGMSEAQLAEAQRRFTEWQGSR